MDNDLIITRLSKIEDRLNKLEGITYLKSPASILAKEEEDSECICKDRVRFFIDSGDPNTAFRWKCSEHGKCDFLVEK
jgi:hypothetical protein